MAESRILTIQRSFAEAYRIRLGHRNGRTPERLVGEIRVTSPNRTTVEAFASVFGGRAKRWEKQHEVYLPVDRLPIRLLPGQTLAQTMELWAGSTRQRCCDGEQMCGGGPCACAIDAEKDPVAMQQSDYKCKPTSRLTVAIPDVPIVGVGKLVTHSWIAAGEMAASIGLVQAVLDAGQSIKGVLRVDQMVGVERRYAVPRIEFEALTFADIALAAGGSSVPTLGSGAPAPLAIEGRVDERTQEVDA